MALAEMAACSRQGRGKEIYGHARPNGNSLLIDHFQLKADLQVNMGRFHQVLGFQHVREKWKNTCSHPSWWEWFCDISSLGKKRDARVHKGNSCLAPKHVPVWEVQSLQTTSVEIHEIYSYQSYLIFSPVQLVSLHKYVIFWLCNVSRFLNDQTIFQLCV